MRAAAAIVLIVLGTLIAFSVAVPDSYPDSNVAREEADGIKSAAKVNATDPSFTATGGVSAGGSRKPRFLFGGFGYPGWGYGGYGYGGRFGGFGLPYYGGYGYYGGLNSFPYGRRFGGLFWR